MKRNSKGIVLVSILLAVLSVSIVFAEEATKTIDVLFNSIVLKVNGKEVKADNIVYNGKTYVPVRAIAEMLDKDVVWDESTNTANINNKPNLSSLGLQFLQGSNSYRVLKQNDEINLNKDTFSIRFNIQKDNEISNNFPCVEIAAVPDEKTFNENVAGVSENDSYLFCPGKAMAAYNDKPYPTLIITDIGFHALWYRNENYRRIDFVKDIDQGVVNVEWKIESIYLSDIDEGYYLSNAPVKTLYLVMYFNRDFDNFIDNDEVVKIKVNLKK